MPSIDKDPMVDVLPLVMVIDKDVHNKHLINISVFVAILAIPLLFVMFILSALVGHMAGALQHGWHFSLFDTYRSE